MAVDGVAQICARCKIELVAVWFGSYGWCRSCRDAWENPKRAKQPPSQKQCTRCGEVKAREAFSLSSGNKCGRQVLASRCKSCTSAVAKMLRDSRGKTKKTDAARAASRRYAERNKDRIALYAATKRSAKDARYLTMCRAKESRRRSRKSKAGGYFAADDINLLLRRQRRKCACCNNKLTAYHVDHVMPIALGGCSDPRNLQILCPQCNRKKHAKHPIDFNRELGLLL